MTRTQCLLLRLLAKRIKKSGLARLWGILHAPRCESDLPIVRQRDICI